VKARSLNIEVGMDGLAALLQNCLPNTGSAQRNVGPVVEFRAVSAIPMFGRNEHSLILADFVLEQSRRLTGGVTSPFFAPVTRLGVSSPGVFASTFCSPLKPSVGVSIVQRIVG